MAVQGALVSRGSAQSDEAATRTKRRSRAEAASEGATNDPTLMPDKSKAPREPLDVRPRPLQRRPPLTGDLLRAIRRGCRLILR